MRRVQNDDVAVDRAGKRRSRCGRLRRRVRMCGGCGGSLSSAGRFGRGGFRGCGFWSCRFRSNGERLGEDVLALRCLQAGSRLVRRRADIGLWRLRLRGRSSWRAQVDGLGRLLLRWGTCLCLRRQCRQGRERKQRDGESGLRGRNQGEMRLPRAAATDCNGFDA